jgi:hypothetical protein
MAKYVMIALNGPTPDGDEVEVERWYRDVHMPELLSIPEIKSARRYKTVGGQVANGEGWPYVAIYEIETDDLQAMMAEVPNKVGPTHPQLDRTRSALIMAIQTAGDD